MKLTERIAKHLRDVHVDKNWTAVNLKDKLADVTWQQATTQVESFHTIATLVFHMNYYISAVLKVLQGGPLDSKDEFSFDLPPIESEEDWTKLLDKTWQDVECVATLIEQLPDEQLWEDFTDEKYGSHYRNFQGLIEHSYYHLGQISLIKTLVTKSDQPQA